MSNTSLILNILSLSAGQGPSPVTQLRNYVQDNRTSLGDALSRLLRDRRFVLFGEMHETTSANEFASVLERLKNEAQKRKETLIIALEANVRTQQRFEKMSIEDLTALVKRNPNDNYLNILLAARRAGIRVVHVDPIGATGTVKQWNQREQGMFDNIVNIHTRNPNARILYYGGSAHCSTSPVTFNREEHMTIGTLLARRFGNKAVASIRTANYAMGLNGAVLPNHLHESSQRLMKEIGVNRPLVIPVSAPIITATGLGTYSHLFIDPSAPRR